MTWRLTRLDAEHPDRCPAAVMQHRTRPVLIFIWIVTFYNYEPYGNCLLSNAVDVGCDRWQIPMQL